MQPSHATSVPDLRRGREQVQTELLNRGWPGRHGWLGRCLGCGDEVGHDEEVVRLYGDVFHTRCALYARVR